MTPLVTDVRWNWDWSPWATALMLAAALIWVVGVYLKEQQFVSRRMRALLALLRLATIALVLVMLAQPTIERRRVAPPRLAVLVDDSASMDTRDVPAADLAGATGVTSHLTRRETSEHLLASGTPTRLDVLRQRFSVDAIRFAATTELIAGLQGEGDAPAEQQSGERLGGSLALPSTESDSNDVDRNATHLGDAIDYALRQLPGPRPAAAVVMTDGVNTAGLPLADAAARARTLDVPLYVVALGSDRPRADVSLDDVLVEEVIFPGDRLQIEAAVRAVGFAGKRAGVTLKGSDADTVLAETEVTLAADGESQPVRLALRPTDPGPMRVVLEVEPQPGENDVANNRVELTIDVRDQPIRALLVDSTPSFEFRALKSLLERDPAIDLRVRLQDADADYASVDVAALRDFPATEAALLEYDVILLGDVDPQLLPRQTWDLLQKFVSLHGGGLVLIAGQRFMPRAFGEIDAMRTLLPIDASGANALRSDVGTSAAVRVVPTPLGLQDPSMQLGETLEESAAIWSELPPVLWSLDAVQPKLGVSVLAVGVRLGEAAAPSREGETPAEPLPVIMRQYVGAGEVLMHATDETWRWRWRNDDRYFARYWGQAVRRLACGRALRGVGSLATNRAEYEIGEPVTVRARLRPKAPLAEDSLIVELAGDATPSREIRLTRKGSHAHVFELTLRGLAPDRYTARIVSQGDDAAPLTAKFVVTAPPSELAQLAVNTTGLAEAAQITGGKFYTAKTAGRLLDELPSAQPMAIEQLPDEPLWNSPWLLAALCVTLGLEWLLRRRAGML